MPVVTTRPRALAASAGRRLGKGQRTFAIAGQILFGTASTIINTLGMFNAVIALLGYGPAVVRLRTATGDRGLT